MESNIEGFMAGKYSLTPAEEAAIRETAVKEGVDPEEAVETARKKMETATGRLREKQAEEAIGGVEKDLEGNRGQKTPERPM